MSDQIDEIRESIMEAMGRISEFWGFSRIMGQLYGLLYLSPKALTLDEMGQGLSVSKGNVSINIRALLRWNMVRQMWVKGDRKDYYEARTDFWEIIRGVLRERERKEFAQALSSIALVRKKSAETLRTGKSPEMAFMAERLERLEDFISTMDRLVGVLITLEDLKKNFWSIGKKK
jgi:DNA-binding transcriptional regulator GbsR (MarR family)